MLENTSKTVYNFTMLESTVNIDAYIDLYNKAFSIKRLKPLENQTYKLFASSYYDIRVASRSMTYTNGLAFNKIKIFLQDNEYFYMIPTTTVKGTIVGFILRGVTNSSYSTITRSFSSYETKVPIMFGLDKTFRTFDKTYEKYNRPIPIIVCEGSKDCLTLKKIYPYVVANNTSSMGLNMIILTNLSNKFLLAYDNDTSGQEGMDKDKKLLRARGCFVDQLKLPDGFKDCTDCWYKEGVDPLLNSIMFDKLKVQVKKKVKNLFNIF